MATSAKKKMRSLQRCIQSVESFSDGQARIVGWTDDLSLVQVEIQPNDGVYKEKKPTFTFEVSLPSEFPNEPPEVHCNPALYHPNISELGSICLSLFDEWRPEFGLDDVIQGLLFLLYNPNFHDPLSLSFLGKHMSDDEYAKNVAKSLNDQTVESFDFGDPSLEMKEEGDMEEEEEEEEEKLGEKYNKAYVTDNWMKEEEDMEGEEWEEEEEEIVAVKAAPSAGPSKKVTSTKEWRRVPRFFSRSVGVLVSRLSRWAGKVRL